MAAANAHATPARFVDERTHLPHLIIMTSDVRAPTPRLENVKPADAAGLPRARARLNTTERPREYPPLRAACDCRTGRTSRASLRGFPAAVRFRELDDVVARHQPL